MQLFLIFLIRYYPQILELKNRPAKEIRGGFVGCNVCPKVPYLSTIPKIADFKAALKKHTDRNTSLNVKEEKTIATDSAEKAIIDGFQKYFQKKHPDEDVFLLFRQNIPGIHYIAKKYERDAVIVNLTKGYILNMEAKSTLKKNVKCCACGLVCNFCSISVHMKVYHQHADFLNHKISCICHKTLRHGTKNCSYCYKLIQMGKSEFESELEKQPKDGLQQLEKTLELLNHNFNGNLEKEWTIITLLYGSKIHDDFPCCDICKPYVFIEEDDFQGKLENILGNENTKDASYSQDFYFLVKELLPLEVKIADTLTNTFNMNTELLSISSRNIKESGKAKNVAFWSPSQANIALQCLGMNRVLFKSG